MAKNVSVPPFSDAPPLTRPFARSLLRVSSKSLWKSEVTAPNMKWQMELQRPVSTAGIREQPSMPPVRRRTEPLLFAPAAAVRNFAPACPPQLCSNAANALITHEPGTGRLRNTALAAINSSSALVYNVMMTMPRKTVAALGNHPLL